MLDFILKIKQNIILSAAKHPIIKNIPSSNMRAKHKRNISYIIIKALHYPTENNKKDINEDELLGFRFLSLFINFFFLSEGKEKKQLSMMLEI